MCSVPQQLTSLCFVAVNIRGLGDFSTQHDCSARICGLIHSADREATKKEKKKEKRGLLLSESCTVHSNSGGQISSMWSPQELPV